MNVKEISQGVSFIFCPGYTEFFKKKSKIVELLLHLRNSEAIFVLLIDENNTLIEKKGRLTENDPNLL